MMDPLYLYLSSLSPIYVINDRNQIKLIEVKSFRIYFLKGQRGQISISTSLSADKECKNDNIFFHLAKCGENMTKSYHASFPIF